MRFVLLPLPTADLYFSFFLKQSCTSLSSCGRFVLLALLKTNLYFSLFLKQICISPSSYGKFVLLSLHATNWYFSLLLQKICTSLFMRQIGTSPSSYDRFLLLPTADLYFSLFLRQICTSLSSCGRFLLLPTDLYSSLSLGIHPRAPIASCSYGSDIVAPSVNDFAKHATETRAVLRNWESIDVFDKMREFV